MRPTFLPARKTHWIGRSLLTALIAGNAAIVGVAALSDVARADAPTTRPANSPPANTQTTAGVVDVRRTVAYLASDALEGRGTGSPGIDLAAGYIAGKFEQMGLAKPPGWESYFQNFKLTTSTTVDPATTLASSGKSDWAATLGHRPALQTDFQPLSFSSEGQFDAPVVFVGYGVADAGQKYDDYAGIDVKGKVVLAFRFEPHDSDGNSAFTRQKDDYSPNAAIPAKAKLAAEKGAVALLLVNPPNFRKSDDITPFAKQTQFERAGIPVIQLRQPAAEALLKAGGLQSLSAIQTRIDTAKAPASAPLAGVQAAAKVSFKREEKDVRNVAALLPGTGPLADEYVVVGAHYDHLGRGGTGSLAPFSRDVHHGADDNASGTSAMLRLADLMAALKSDQPRRSILFVAFTAEEIGLIGSAHFVKSPPVPTEKMAAMINFDMVGRVRENKLQVGGTGTADSFEKILTEANEGLPLKLNFNSKGGFGPSDHTSFATKRIPVLFFFSGLHADYHRPSDTADKINYEGIEHVVTLGQRTLSAIASRPREQYVAKFDGSGMMGMSGSGSGSGSGGNRVSLGVVPDYAGEDVKGVPISGTSPGSAAEKAGLKGGDVLTDFGDMKLNNLQDLTTALGKAEVGQVVKIKLQRDGKPVEVEAKLTARRTPPPEPGPELPPGHGDPHALPPGHGDPHAMPATRPTAQPKK
jgi:hypothetical protein